MISGNRLAQIHTPTGSHDLTVKADYGSFSSPEEAQAVALEKANAMDIDTVIVQDGESFKVFGIDEMHPILPPGGQGADITRDAPIVSFVASDPNTGKENIIGRTFGSHAGPSPVLPETDIEKYAKKFDSQLDEVLGDRKAAFVSQLRHFERQIEAQGINIKIELDDDVFENEETLKGYKNFLEYASENIEVLQKRSINEISIEDEYDNWWGVKAELDYDKDTQTRALELGDDFLDGWGEGLIENDSKQIDKYEKKLTKALGKTLSDDELLNRTRIFGEIKGTMASTHQKLSQLQQNLDNLSPEELEESILELNRNLRTLEHSTIPEAEDIFDDFSVKDEKKMSLEYLKTFERTLKEVRQQLRSLRKESKEADPLATRARMEKTKIFIMKGVKDIPDQRNYFGGYLSGDGNGDGIPGMGMQYSRSLGRDKNTIASIKLGQTAGVTVNGENHSDIVLGLGIGHTFRSNNHLVDGSYVGIGVGIGRETPFFIGANASQSWYLNDYHGIEDQWSVVGGAYASVGTLTNVGGFIDVHKKLSSHVDFEGSGEISLFTQTLEAEAEFQLGKDKDIYLTAGVGTNKLVYAGIGFADKYELEVGLGGLSFGKDSNNLPGETMWEVGIRTWLPIPYFRHHRVPGYKFEYKDGSTEYVTPKGTFMTIKENDDGAKERVSYILDQQITEKNLNEIAYRIARSNADLDNFEELPIRKITLGPLGYVTVTEGDKVLIDDGLVSSEISDADLGIITDQTGVLWFNKRQNDDPASLTLRREDMPLPLYRLVHH